MILKAQGGFIISQIKLSQKTGLAKTMLTGMLDRMEKAGLVERVFDKTDRRKTLIILTEKAHRLKNDYSEVSSQMNKISVPITNNFCPQTLFIYGTYK